MLARTIDALNKMNTQTAAFALLNFAGLFAVTSVGTAIWVQRDAVWISFFGLANQCAGGALIMLRAAGKDVVTNNAPGSHVGQQNVAGVQPGSTE